ncbi:unnamed protein product [Amoebophrya sp. A120]|nr:unnamed protein product [Amoebophrya sp. A120]|eukprot:GSA120T00019323001.1
MTSPAMWSAGAGATPEEDPRRPGDEVLSSVTSPFGSKIYDGEKAPAVGDEPELQEREGTTNDKIVTYQKSDLYKFLKHECYANAVDLTEPHGYLMIRGREQEDELDYDFVPGFDNIWNAVLKKNPSVVKKMQHLHSSRSSRAPFSASNWYAFWGERVNEYKAKAEEEAIAAPAAAAGFGGRINPDQPVHESRTSREVLLYRGQDMDLQIAREALVETRNGGLFSEFFGAADVQYYARKLRGPADGIGAWLAFPDDVEAVETTLAKPDETGRHVLVADVQLVSEFGKKNDLLFSTGAPEGPRGATASSRKDALLSQYQLQHLETFRNNLVPRPVQEKESSAKRKSNPPCAAPSSFSASGSRRSGSDSPAKMKPLGVDFGVPQLLFSSETGFFGEAAVHPSDAYWLASHYSLAAGPQFGGGEAKTFEERYDQKLKVVARSLEQVFGIKFVKTCTTSASRWDLTTSGLLFSKPFLRSEDLIPRDLRHPSEQAKFRARKKGVKLALSSLFGERRQTRFVATRFAAKRRFKRKNQKDFVAKKKLKRKNQKEKQRNSPARKVKVLKKIIKKKKLPHVETRKGPGAGSAAQPPLSKTFQQQFKQLCEYGKKRDDAAWAMGPTAGAAAAHGVDVSTLIQPADPIDEASLQAKVIGFMQHQHDKQAAEEILKRARERAELFGGGEELRLRVLAGPHGAGHDGDHLCTCGLPRWTGVRKKKEQGEGAPAWQFEYGTAIGHVCACGMPHACCNPASLDKMNENPEFPKWHLVQPAEGQMRKELARRRREKAGVHANFGEGRVSLVTDFGEGIEARKRRTEEEKRADTRGDACFACLTNSRHFGHLANDAASKLLVDGDESDADGATKQQQTTHNRSKKRQGKRPRDQELPVGNATAVKSKAEREKLLEEHDRENTKSFALRDALAHFGIPEYHWLLALLVFSNEISPHVQVAGDDAVAAGVLKEAKRRVEAIRKLFDREILLNQAALLADLHWAREKAEREAREKKMLQSLHKIHELQKARQLAQMGQVPQLPAYLFADGAAGTAAGSCPDRPVLDIADTATISFATWKKKSASEGTDRGQEEPPAAGHQPQSGRGSDWSVELGVRMGSVEKRAIAQPQVVTDTVRNDQQELKFAEFLQAHVMHFPTLTIPVEKQGRTTSFELDIYVAYWLEEVLKRTKIRVEKGPDPTDIQNTWDLNDWNRAAEAAKCYEIENPIFEKTEKLQLMKDYIQEKSRKHHEKRRVTELQDLHAEQQAQAKIKRGEQAGLTPMNAEQAQVLIQLYAAKALQPGGTITKRPTTQGRGSSSASASSSAGIIPQQLLAAASPAPAQLVKSATQTKSSRKQAGKGPASGGTMPGSSARAAEGTPASTAAPAAEPSQPSSKEEVDETPERAKTRRQRERRAALAVQRRLQTETEKTELPQL